MDNVQRFPAVSVTAKAEKSLKGGHPWVYDSEVTKADEACGDGDLAEVHGPNGRWLGTGFFNSRSKIRVRLITRNRTEKIDVAFWARRVKYAVDYRRTVMGDDFDACRLIFGEADGFPGLTVDRFADVLSVQCLSYGTERQKDAIYAAVVRELRAGGAEIRAVYERNDSPIRELEGMEAYKAYWCGCEGLGEIPDGRVAIRENGLLYDVDFAGGQKTGFFLDQKYNRLAIQRLCKGKKVLDCFTHMGTFALNAGIAGAADVTGLDISEFAVSQATANAKLNGLDSTVKFRQANVLDELPKLAEAGEKYDVVILDPPAFTKSREATKNAMKGYREINMKGLKLVKDGGYLATCSCSHFMTQDLFIKVIGQAAKAAHKRLRQVEFRTQAPDHPILWAADESYYLKFLVFQVVDEK
jgi:23S rRNA (cytosine1962-C5)-methyltransferase